jgi:hypothetical protein
MPKSDLSIHERMKIITFVTMLFNRNIELENVVAPREDEYDPLIEAYQQMAKDLRGAMQSMDKMPASEFTDIISGMLHAMRAVVDASTEQWVRLKDKAHGTGKYGFFEYRRNTKRIAQLIKERQRWGQKMNELNHSIVRKNEA